MAGGMDDVVEALRASEERYRTLFEQAPVGVFLYDRTLTITDCNDRFIVILRSSREKLVGLDMHMLRDRAVLPALEGALQGAPTLYEGPYAATTSGAKVWVSMRLAPLRSAAGEVIGGMGIVEDISERKNAEEALVRSEARFRELIERAPDYIGISRNGVWLYVNPALVSYLGSPSAADLVGHDVAKNVHPDDHARVGDLRRALLAGPGTPLAAEEFRMVRHDGSTVSAEIVALVVDWDGAPAIMALGRDLTERKLMQARLLQADRMVSVGTLAAGVAHEINNPLAYVMANLHLIATRRLPVAFAALERPSGPDVEAARAALGSASTMLEVAREGTERVRVIVRDLKSFSRPDDEAVGPVDVRRVLDASVNMAWNEIRHRARLERTYDDVPPVHGNEARLGQVFLNLLVNAAQAIPDGAAMENVIHVRAGTDLAGQVYVEIEDSGQGISREAQGRVFDPFFTTKPPGVGTGLGLWICQGIISSLRGTISVDSVVGRGTRVRVSLPAAAGFVRESPSARSPVSFRRGRVLVVDDEEAIAHAMREVLQEDHEVVAVTSGREALALLRSGKRFDAVLCDVMMPDLSGMDLYRLLADDVPDLASSFVFVTGGAFTAAAQELLDRAPNPRLDKPIDVEKLRRTVARLVDRARASEGEGGERK
jgi:PAS domain S-box-containing protein